MYNKENNGLNASRATRVEAKRGMKLSRKRDIVDLRNIYLSGTTEI